MNRPWTPRERSTLASRYATDGSLALAVALDRSPDSITSQARRYGLSSPGARLRQARTRVLQSRSVNVEFFAGQSTAVAFVLGLVWACGTVKTKHRQVLRLALPSDRVGSLRRVKELMEIRHSIQTRNSRPAGQQCVLTSQGPQLHCCPPVGLVASGPPRWLIPEVMCCGHLVPP
jgi:hypothetical protein